MRFRQDPVAISSGYVFMSMLVGILLFAYARMLFGVRTGAWTLGLYMLSASMTENGRSIWQAHPTILFVSAYLAVTEYAFRRRMRIIYSRALGIYAVCDVLSDSPPAFAVCVPSSCRPDHWISGEKAVYGRRCAFSVAIFFRFVAVGIHASGGGFALSCSYSKTGQHR